MKASEIRDKDAEELASLEQDLRAQLIQLRVNQATSRRVSTAQFNRIRRDIARIKTVQRERALGITRD